MTYARTAMMSALKVLSANGWPSSSQKSGSSSRAVPLAGHRSSMSASHLAALSGVSRARSPSFTERSCAGVGSSTTRPENSHERKRAPCEPVLTVGVTWEPCRLTLARADAHVNHHPCCDDESRPRSHGPRELLDHCCTLAEERDRLFNDWRRDRLNLLLA
eukprot:7381360-Prymnesium_polylepis.1